MRTILVIIIATILVTFVGMSNASANKQTDTIGLKLVAKGFTAPVALVSPDDGTGRLFIVDQTGVIKILKDGKLKEFLNISSKIVPLNPIFDERGLLGLAFHPKFKKNGLFYVYYSIPLRNNGPVGWDHTNRISEFKVSKNNPNKADINSERILLENDHPQFNHNAGQIAFGPDGFLYIPIGDGGGGNDIGLGHPDPGNAQNISVLLGKILRIDIDGGAPYKIPKDNPFVGKNGLDEIYAYGFRNPFHISFDAKDGHRLFASDAGQNLWEEVDMVKKGENYGWHIKEGTHCFDPNNPNVSPDTCPDTGANGEKLVNPIIEYKNAHQSGGIGFVVIGGYIYRGNDIPKLKGKYIFGDWSNNFTIGNGTILVGIPPKGEKGKSKANMWQIKELKISNREDRRIDTFVRSFGQDSKNELYILTSDILGPNGKTGKVFKIIK